MEKIYENVTSPNASAGDWQAYEDLLAGKSVFSDIGYSNRIGGYCFALGEPVTQDGQVIGALRCVLGVSILMQEAQQGGLNEVSAQCIVDQAGDIVYCDLENEPWEGVNLLEALQAEGTEEETVEGLRASFVSDLNVTLAFNSGAGGKRGFVSSTTLGYKDWSLVRFDRTTAMEDVSRKVLRSTMLASAVLILLTALLGGGTIWAFSRQRRRIELDQARYDALSQFADTVLFEYVYKTDSLRFTSNAAHLLPLQALRVDNFHRHRFQTMCEEDVEPVMEMFERARESGQPQSLEVRLRRKDGSLIWCKCRVQPIGGRDGVDMLVGKLADIDEMKKKELDLLERSTTDALTGLLNRESLQSGVDELLRAEQEGFLFMMDIDNFKSVNDSFGHGEGDKLLGELGEILRGSFREHDPVGRVGGDEFVAFMPDTCNPDIASLKAELILHKITALRTGGGECVSASIGISSCPREGATYAELFSAADRAMYQAKQRGKNQVAFSG